MPKYKVNIVIHSSYTREREVNAIDEDEARTLAYENVACDGVDYESLIDNYEMDILNVEKISDDTEVSDEQDAINVDNARKARELK